MAQWFDHYCKPPGSDKAEQLNRFDHAEQCYVGTDFVPVGHS